MTTDNPNVQNPELKTQNSKPKTVRSSDYRLYKRVGAREIPQYLKDGSRNPEVPRDPPWYFKFEFRAKTYPRCLETNDAGQAQARAKKIADAIKSAIIRQSDSELLATRTRQPQTSSVGELLAVYQQEARIAAVHANISVMKGLIRRVYGAIDDAALRTLRTSIFTEEFWTTVQDQLVKPGLPEGEEKRTAVTNLHSLVGQARSIFRRNLMAVYAKNKIRFAPGLVQFLAWQPLYKEPTHKFQRIPGKLLKDITAAAVALKQTNPNAYRAWLLSRYCGLRRGEIARACWSHIFVDEHNSTPTEKQYALHLDRTKNGDPRNAPMSRTVYDELVSLAKVVPMPSDVVIDPGAPFDGAAADFILEGGWKTRYETAGDDFALWLKAQGWNRRKKLHELRKQVGTEFADDYGTRVAAAVLGNSEKVFAAHYDAVALPKLKLFGT
jgi:integrase